MEKFVRILKIETRKQKETKIADKNKRESPVQQKKGFYFLVFLI